jgi:cytochrome c-type protein NapB
MMNLKKKIAAILVAAALAATCGLAVGCQSNDASAVMGTETTPKMMPALHQKYVDRTAYQCYKCHGASEKGDPSASGAVKIPDGHYVNQDRSTMELDASRNNCRQCHVVDANKEMDAAKLEAAEVETGQDKLDGE